MEKNDLAFKVTSILITHSSNPSFAVLALRTCIEGFTVLKQLSDTAVSSSLLNTRMLWISLLLPLRAPVGLSHGALFTANKMFSTKFAGKM